MMMRRDLLEANEALLDYIREPTRKRWTGFVRKQQDFVQAQPQPDTLRDEESRRIFEDLQSSLDEHLTGPIDPQTTAERIAEDLTPTWQRVLFYTLAGAFLYWLYRLGLQEDDTSDVEGIVESEPVTEAITDVNTRVRQRIRTILREELAKPEPTREQVERRILSEVTELTRDELKRIARTEMWRVEQTARVRAYDEQDTLVVWVNLSGSCETCDTIAERTGDGVTPEELQRIIEDVATTKSWDPTRGGGIGVPHPNCRCSAEPVPGEVEL